MEEDPIMQELRQARKDLLREAGGDLAKLIERANLEGRALWDKYRKIAVSRAERRRPTTAKPAKKTISPFRSTKAKSRKA